MQTMKLSLAESTFQLGQQRAKGEIRVDTLNNFLDNLLLYSAIFCGVSALLIAIALFFVYRALNRFSKADTTRLQLHFSELQAKAPASTQEKLLRKIVHQQAVRCGTIGAITSLGGFYTLPIALPADIILSTQIQASMVEFIAARYGKADTTEVERRVRNALVVSGGLRASESSTRLAMRFITGMVGKSFAKLIPLVGAVIGFAVNYSIARGTGELALRYYSSSARDSTSANPLL